MRDYAYRARWPLFGLIVFGRALSEMIAKVGPFPMQQFVLSVMVTGAAWVFFCAISEAGPKDPNQTTTNGESSNQ